MKILRLTNADTTREDRSVWVNFDFVDYIERHYNDERKALDGARIHFSNNVTVLVSESAKDIIQALSVMDNKPYNVGIAYYVNVKKRTGGSK